jgi:peptidoglycan/xylan/chitin deacetylase (PgdA/CDA1 family)
MCLRVLGERSGKDNLTITSILVRSVNIPVLLYHHVVPKIDADDLRPFIITEFDFMWQLDLLEDYGYTPITLSDLFETSDLTNKVIITFDDCPKNLLDHAIPHLEKKKWPGVFFAPYSHLGGVNQWNVARGKTKMELMTHDEIVQLATTRHEIGAHSMTHPHLNQCTDETAEAEIRQSKTQLEQLVNRPVTSFAYPYGHYPDRYVEIMSGCGYKTAVSMYSKARSTLSDPYCIRRTVVTDKESSFSLKVKLSGVYNNARVLYDYYKLWKEGVK